MSYYDDKHDWLHQPFEWWQDNKQPAMGIINLNNKSGLNVLAALHDIYLDIKNRKYNSAVASTEMLASSIIAVAVNETDRLLEAVTESSIQDTDFDAELAKLLEEGDSNDKA